MTKVPIVLFVYNRPEHTARTVEALLNNDLAAESDLVIYSDGPHTTDFSSEVATVRKYIREISGFKSLTIVERSSNWGLSNSIIDGVTTVVNQFGKVIVMEDDLVSAPHFLDYMNKALEYYSAEKSIWHVSGWNYPIGTDNPNESFLWRVMNCWGWGTWADRWGHFSKDADRLVREWTNDDIWRFNLDGTEKNFWRQVQANYNGQIDTWAVFWYASIFEKNGLCLNPAQTMVDNIGFDAGGVHCRNDKPYIDDLNKSNTFEFPDVLTESELFVGKIKQHLNTSLFQKLRRRIMWK